jgi:hypothetical protein
MSIWYNFTDPETIVVKYPFAVVAKDTEEKRIKMLVGV